MTVTFMPLAAFGSETTLRRVAIKARNKPRRDNGEADLLAFLGPEWRYEPWQYPLDSCLPFTPDFWRPEKDGKPELHIELTWLDWAIARHQAWIADASGSSRKARSRHLQLAGELRELQLRWKRKQRKVSETNRLYGPVYGLRVILLTRTQSEGLLAGKFTLEELCQAELAAAS